jgi:integrase
MSKQWRSQMPKPFTEGRMWWIRFYENRLKDGKPQKVRTRKPIGPAEGPGRLTFAEAENLAWHLYLKHLQPQAEVACTVAEFYEQKFMPQVTARLRRGSQKDYETRWRNWVEPVLGMTQLQQVTPDQVEQAVYQAIKAGRSVQTARHIRKLIQAMFSYAKKKRWYVGENPGNDIELPVNRPKEVHAYDEAEAVQVIAGLGSPVREAALLSLCTGLGPAEFRALRWSRLNLSGETILRGTPIPPASLRVSENFNMGQFTGPKAEKRHRIVPLLPVVVEALTGLRARSSFTAEQDLVFASRNGTPLDTHNITNRAFKKLSEKLKIPVGWYIFRHTHATWMERDGVSLFDRVAQMGHSRWQQTLAYTKPDIERRRAALSGIEASLRKKPVSEKVVSIDVAKEA